MVKCRNSFQSMALLVSLILTGHVMASGTEDELAEWGSDPADQAAEIARDYLAAQLPRTFGLRHVVLDQIGQAHVRFDQLYGKIPVFEGQVIVHVELKSGSVRGVTDATLEVALADTQPQIQAPEAEGIANSLLRLQGKTEASTVLMVFVSEDGAAHLAWRVNVRRDNPTRGPADWMTFVDARDGKVLLSYDNLHTRKQTPPPLPTEGTPVMGTAYTRYVGAVELPTEQYLDGTFGMRDPVRGNNYTTDMLDMRTGDGALFTDADNLWGDFTDADPATAGTDAHFGAGMTWDYYDEVHGRQGVYDDGKGILSRVHYGRDYVNAFWSDSCQCVTYGDGDGVTASPLVSLDIAAHEITHGVTSATADLTYSGESGGLNESMSDIFGTAVEFFAAAFSDTVPDYWCGEDVWTPLVSGDALRYMDHPTLDGRSIDHYSNYSDGMDVHLSSGIANNVFYLLSEGGTNDTSGMNVAGIGRDKAERVFFRALTAYMTPGTDFKGARESTINAALDLYDQGTADVVASAWAACGVD